jgi:hypothetical protein
MLYRPKIDYGTDQSDSVTPTDDLQTNQNQFSQNSFFLIERTGQPAIRRMPQPAGHAP